MNTFTCGHNRTVSNTNKAMTTGNRCLTCCNARDARNKAMVADWLGGMMQVEVAKKYGISSARLSIIIRLSGARLSTAEHGRRTQSGIKRRGRKLAWPNCPDHLRAQYIRMRKSYGYSAADARAILEAGEAA